MDNSIYNDKVEYMVRRALTILLSDLRAWNADLYKVSFDVENTGTLAKEETNIFLPELILLFNLWRCSRLLSKNIIDHIKIPKEWTVIDSKTTDANINGNINWEKTIQHRLSGGNGFVIKNLHRKDAIGHAIYISTVLGEYIIHCNQIINKILQAMNNSVPSYLSNIIDEINQVKWMVENVRNKKLYRINTQCQNKLNKINTTFSEILFRNDSNHESILDDYENKVNLKKPRGTFLPNITKDVLDWRQEYLSCCTGLTDSVYLSFVRKGSESDLYEIWCFYEICLAIKRVEKTNISQLCAIDRKQNKSQFKIGNKNYVYFDYHTETLKPFIEDTIKCEMPGFFVEWFIHNKNNYKQSICIDMKYAHWESREVLKVLGYMVNFGILNGAIIIKDKIRSKTIGGNEITPGLNRIKFPNHNNETLWILSLIPDKKNENDNKNILDEFILRSSIISSN